MAPELARLIRRDLTRTYYEPFLGGGAVFFNLRPAQAVLSDINTDLINTYRMVRERPETLIDLLKAMPVSPDFYYKVRSQRLRSPIRQAARFLYLNRTCFGGIYRLNSKGKFNVPFAGGQRTPRALWTQDLLLQASRLLKPVAIHVQDFRRIMAHAGPGDVIYCDPTYTVAHDNNGFIRYNETNFSWDDQKRLASAAKQAARRGATVLVTNAHHRSISALYPTATRRLVKRKSLVCPNPSHRCEVHEYLFILRPS